MFGTRWIPWVALVMAIAATWISWNLTKKHVLHAPVPGWFDSMCKGDAEDGAAGCEAVLASPYSYFPPKYSDKPDGRPHFPVAMLGLAYYSIIAVWLIGIGPPSRGRRALLVFPYLLLFGGLMGSAYFLYIMDAELDTWCPLCLVTHALNLLIAVSFALMWPRKVAVASEAESAPSEIGDDGRAVVVHHPSGRLVVTTLVAAITLVVGEFSIIGLKDWQQKAKVMEKHALRCKAEYGELTNDGSLFFSKWQSASRCAFPGLPRAPGRHRVLGGGPSWDAVVFSDFECPFCKKLAVFFERTVEPMFGGGLTLRFKHYPLHRACNPQTTSEMHPHACLGARLAEAARSVGGSDAFWNAHDYLFAHRDRLKTGRLRLADLADHLGVDGERLAQAMTEDSIRDRIDEDASLAARLGVHSTPSIFIDGRRVPAGATLNLAFWDQLADAHWQAWGTPRPAATPLDNVAPTRGTQDRPAARRPSASPRP